MCVFDYVWSVNGVCVCLNVHKKNAIHIYFLWHNNNNNNRVSVCSYTSFLLLASPTSRLRNSFWIEMNRLTRRSHYILIHIVIDVFVGYVWKSSECVIIFKPAPTNSTPQINWNWIRCLWWFGHLYSAPFFCFSIIFGSFFYSGHHWMLNENLSLSWTKKK